VTAVRTPVAGHDECYGDIATACFLCAIKSVHN
jgi:hypothetical protein